MLDRDSEYLMLEDSGTDVEIFLSDFEEYGIVNKFHIARNVEEALEYLFVEDGSLRVKPPKVIFLDLHMPKVTGLEFIRRIKLDDNTKDIPVIVLKSSISPIEKSECQQLGINDYIEKPLDYENFISVIKKYSKLLNSKYCVSNNNECVNA